MKGIVEEDHSAASSHPAWCANGPECAPGVPRPRHRSTPVMLSQGIYGGAVTQMGLFAPYGFHDDVGVEIALWADDLDPAKDEPDHRMVFTLDEAAAFSRTLYDLVRQAIEPLDVREATARLTRARKLVADLIAADRIVPDVERNSLADQLHAVVPVSVVQQLAGILAPGEHPVIDPYDYDVREREAATR